MDFDTKADELYLDFNEPAKEVGPVLNVVQTGKLLYVSGALPFKEARLSHKGRVGIEVTTDSARLASHAACLQALGFIRKYLDGSLNKVKKVVMLRGYVASASEFHEQGKVLDGASQLLVELFGPVAGKHARVAVGVNVLPNNAPVMIELVVEIK